MVRLGSREASQSHCALEFMAHRCDYTSFFRRTTKNPVAYATSWSLTLSPDYITESKSFAV